MSQDLTQKLPKSDRDAILTAIQNLDTRVGSIDSRIQSLETRVGNIDSRVQGLAQKWGILNKRWTRDFMTLVQCGTNLKLIFVSCRKASNDLKKVKKPCVRI